MLSELLAVLRERNTDKETEITSQLISGLRGDLQEISRQYTRNAELEEALLCMWAVLSPKQMLELPTWLHVKVQTIKQKS